MAGDPPPVEPLDSSRRGWQHVDLRPYLDGTHEPVRPTLGFRTDGVPILYPGGVHWLYGEPESGKSMTALALAAQVIAGGERVFWIDYEATAGDVVARLLALRCDAETLPRQFAYFGPDRPFGYGFISGTGNPVWAEYLAKARPALVVIDSCNESMAVEGLDPISILDVPTWIARLPRFIARRGASVVVIDHVVKNRESRGRWPIGAQGKMSGCDVALSLEARSPFGIGMTGRSALHVAKDRHGQLRRSTLPGREGMGWLGDVTVAESGGRTTVEITPPAGDGGRFRPTTLMQKVSEAIARAPNACTTRDVQARVRARAADVQTALAALVDEGWVSVEPKGASKLHRVVEPYTGQDASRFPRFPSVSGNASSSVSPSLEGKRETPSGNDSEPETVTGSITPTNAELLRLLPEVD